MLQTAGVCYNSTATEIKAAKPVQGLADNLHGLASRLSVLNDRLYSALNRLCGNPGPTAASGSTAQPEPDGALLVAQFGAERIRQQIEALEDQLSRLETTV